MNLIGAGLTSRLPSLAKLLSLALLVGCNGPRIANPDGGTSPPAAHVGAKADGLAREIQPPSEAATVKSEIARGWTAGFDCQPGDDSNLFRQCVNHIAQSAAGTASDTRPFELGLRLRAFRLATRAKTDTRLDDVGQGLYALVALAESYRATALTDELHLTQAQTDSALPSD